MDEIPDYTATVKVRISGMAIVARIDNLQVNARIKNLVQGALHMAGELGTVLECWGAQPVCEAPDPESPEFARGYQDMKDAVSTLGLIAGTQIASQFLGRRHEIAPTSQFDYGRMHAAAEILRQVRAAADGLTEESVQRAGLAPERSGSTGSGCPHCGASTAGMTKGCAFCEMVRRGPV